MTDTPPPVAFIDNPNAPDVFSSGASGFFVVRGNVGITFETIRVDHSTTPGPVSRVVIGRLVLPPDAAHELAVGLFDFLKAQGYADPLGQARQ